MIGNAYSIGTAGCFFPAIVIIGLYGNIIRDGISALYIRSAGTAGNRVIVEAAVGGKIGGIEGTQFAITLFSSTGTLCAEGL